MSLETIKESIEITVPVSTAYNQWTQFEDFPNFMEGVESVAQIDDTHLHWVAEIGGERREWDAEIVDQVPDRKVAWRAVDGNGPNGVVAFEPLGDDKTMVVVEMSYEPEGMKEQLGSKIGLDSRQVKKDLERFKQLIEAVGAETGGWRGEVHAGESR
ncbi:MAG: SRPBCC family protein [Actinomycetota bacterium]